MRCDAVRKKHPGYEIAVTGLSAIAARNSANMIEKLNRGLTIEFVFVAVFIGLAFRSAVVMFACILPGIFPVVLSGTLLVAARRGAAIRQRGGAHRLVRPRPERDHPLPQPAAARGDAGRGLRRSAVERATVLVGPALILTTVVLACGLVVTVFSDLPSLRLFGWLSAFSMMSALIADLFILRPTAMFLRRTADALAARRGAQADAAR